MSNIRTAGPEASGACSSRGIEDPQSTPPKCENQEQVRKDATAAERQRRYRQRKRNACERDTVTDRDADTRDGRDGYRDAEGRHGRDAETVTRSGVLLACQPQVTFEITFDGDLVLVQHDALCDDVIIVINAENIETFVDKLTDTLGYASVP